MSCNKSEDEGENERDVTEAAVSSHEDNGDEESGEEESKEDEEACLVGIGTAADVIDTSSFGGRCGRLLCFNFSLALRSNFCHFSSYFSIVLSLVLTFIARHVLPSET